MRVELGSKQYADLAAEVAPRFRIDRQKVGGDKDKLRGKRHQVKGVRFTYVGMGASRVAMRGPDGVVYKATTAGSLYATQQSDEVELFDRLSEIGVPWVPDYWPWREDVIAMPKYRPVDPNNFYTTYDKTIAEMDLVNDDVHESNCGLDKDGQLVLIDGGLSNPYGIERLASQQSQ